MLSTSSQMGRGGGDGKDEDEALVDVGAESDEECGDVGNASSWSS